MKKLLILVTLLFTFTLSSNSLYAQSTGTVTRSTEENTVHEFGEILTIDDTATPEDTDGVMSSKITAITTSTGISVFPCYKDSTLIDIEVESGTLVSEPQLIEYGDTKFYRLQFEETESEVSYTATSLIEELYVTEEQDFGDTFPSGIELIVVKLYNTTPVEIQNYTLAVAVPKDRELLSIIDYSPKKPYSMPVIGDYTYGMYDFEDVKPGEKVELEVHVYETSSTVKMILWPVGIIGSIAYLYYSRDLLNQAKKAKKDKKQKEAQQ